MKFALVGGDARSALLGRMLLRDGHRVSCFALERAAPGPELTHSGCLHSCIYGADCVILPAPAEKGGLLNAPLSDTALPMGELLGALWPGQLICGGKFSESSRALALRSKLRLEDMMERERFCAVNAALTAEAAVGLLINELDRALFGARVLVLGWGRIGKLLAVRLVALGAKVSVCARSGRDLAMTEALGFRALGFGELESELGGFDAVVNTVPARVLTDAMLCLIGEEALLLELASPPGGFDRTLAENISLRCVYGASLPGRFSPRSAAELIKTTVYRLLEEGEYQYE